MSTERTLLLLAALLAATATLHAQVEPEPQTPTTPPATGVEQQPAEPPAVPPNLTPVEPIDEEEADAAKGGPGEPSYAALMLETGAGRDDGLRSQDPNSTLFDQPTDQTLYLARASLLLYRHPSERTSFTLAYRPELERFGGSSSFDIVNHEAGVLLDQKPSRRTRLVASGTFLDGDDPSRYLGDLLAVVPRSNFRQEQAHLSLERLWRESTVGVHAGYVATRVDPVATIFVNGVDQRDWLGSLSYDRTLGRSWTVSAVYSYDQPQGRALVVDSTLTPAPVPATAAGDMPPDATPATTTLEPLQSLVIGAALRPDEDFVVDASAGVTEISGNSTWVASFGVRRDGRRAAWGLRYDRSLASFTNGLGTAGSAGGTATAPGAQSALLRDTVSSSLSFGFGIRFGERATWTQLSRVSRTELLAGETLQSYLLGSRLLVRGTQRLGVFGEVDYLDQRRTEFSPPFSRLRYAAGLVFGVGGPSAPTALLLERSRVESVLPIRGGDFQ
jgi:hypothetical protein